MRWHSVLVAAALIAASRGVLAADGTIGVFADPAGTQSHVELTLGAPTTVYVLAQLEGASGAGLSGAEFRIDGLPADWIAQVTANPAASIALGDPLHRVGGIHHTNVAFATCQASSPVLLYSVLIIPTSVNPPVVLHVARADPPTNVIYSGPMLLLCDAPYYSPVVASGEDFTIDGVSAPRNLDYPAQSPYRGRSGVNPTVAHPGETVHFRVACTSQDGVPPRSVKLDLDANGDGDSDDTNEGRYTMLPVTPAPAMPESLQYRCEIAVPRLSTERLRYRFVAEDPSGHAIGGRASAWNDSLSVIGRRPELAVRSEDVLTEPVPATNPPMHQVTVRFRNASDVPVDGVRVFVDNLSWALQLNRIVPHLEPGQQATFTFVGAFETARPLRVRLDPWDEIIESDESNNSATTSMLAADSEAMTLGIGALAAILDMAPLEPRWVAANAYYRRDTGGGGVAAGTRFQWEPSWEALQATWTDASGTTGIEIVAPSTPGDYPLVITATDGRRSDSKSVIVRVHSGPAIQAPDLVLEPEPTIATCAGAVPVVAWQVRNRGDVTAFASHVRIEGEHLETLEDISLPELQPGGTIRIQPATLAAWTVGHHWISARVDAQNDNAEQREDDGLSTVVFDIAPSSANLAAQWSSVEAPACTYVPIRVRARVVNTGCATASAATVSCRVSGVQLAQVPLAALAPGAEQLFQFETYSNEAVCRPFEITVLGTNGDAEPVDDTDLMTVCVGLCTWDPAGLVNYSIRNCDLEVNDRSPIAGEPLTFAAHIANTGSVAGVVPVVVRFLLDDLPLGTDVLVGPIEPGQVANVTASVPWSADFGSHRLRVLVDPANTHVEQDEADNQGVVDLPYDIRLAPMPRCSTRIPGTFSSCEPCSNAPVTIRAVVVNAGIFDVDSVRVDFVETTAPTPQLLASIMAPASRLTDLCNTIDPITIEARFGSPGDHTVTIIADADERWPESNETDNRHSETLSVTCRDLPNLYTTISWPGLVLPGDTIPGLDLLVENSGVVTAQDVHVRLRLNGDPLCEDLVAPIVPGLSSARLHCPATWVVGHLNEQTLEACADPLNAIPEMNETDNCLTTGPPFQLVDLDAHHIRASPEEPRLGDPMQIEVTIANIGAKAATANIHLEWVDLDGNVRSIGDAPIQVPRGAYYASTSFFWVAEATHFYFHAIISGGNPPDPNPDNDDRWRWIPVNGEPSPTVLRDLRLESALDGVHVHWVVGPGMAAFHVERRRAEAGDLADWIRLTTAPLEASETQGDAGFDFIDDTAPADADLEYRILGRALGEVWTALGVASVRHDAASRHPLAFDLAVSNPFGSRDVLRVTMPRDGDVRLGIFDVAGRRIAAPFAGRLSAGTHAVPWDARDSFGHTLPAGVYFCHLESAGASRVRRFVIVR